MNVRVGDDVLMGYVRSRASKKRISTKNYSNASSWFHQPRSEDVAFRNASVSWFWSKQATRFIVECFWLQELLAATSSTTYKEVVNRQRRQHPTASTSIPSSVCPWLFDWHRKLIYSSIPPQYHRSLLASKSKPSISPSHTSYIAQSYHCFHLK